MESILGRDEHEEAVDETAKSKLRAELAKRMAQGGGWSVGVAMVYGAYELLRNNPKEAFPLLQSWGPRTIIGFVAIWVVYDVVKICLNIFKRAVIAMEKTAVALNRIGDKDDRQLQEVQTLTAYTSQQAEKHGTMLRDISGKLDRLLAGGETR